MEIADLDSLELESPDVTDGNDLAERLLIAFNLNLKRLVLTNQKASYVRPYVNAGQTCNPILTEEPRSNGGRIIQIKLNEEISPQDSYSRYIELTESVGEKAVLETLRRINKLFKAPGDLRASNLKKALERYEDSMTSCNMRSTFLSLYIALENAVNYDCNDKHCRDENFDKKASKIIGVQEEVIAKWRTRANRIKHVDSNYEEMNKYNSGMKELPTCLESLRQATNKAIISRLKNLDQ